ncbi:MAG: hypothetical protein K2Z80_22425 [Xanthobacteraceae bacterium]|jgi:hypothetical protein|nr:hypothetical protein [Xanthobacteraceae bacterium]
MTMKESEKRELVSAHVRKIAPLFAVPLTYLHDISLRLVADYGDKIFDGDKFKDYYVDLSLAALMDDESAAHLFKRDDAAEESTPTTPELSAAEQERERLTAWLASDAGQKASPIERMRAADLLQAAEAKATKSAKDLSFERYMQNRIKGIGRDWETWSPERRNLACIEARAEFDAARKGEAV